MTENSEIPTHLAEPVRPLTSDTGLTLDVIDTREAFDAAKPAWDALHEQDPEATVFLSWDWLSCAFRQNSNRWRVFAIRRGEDYVCIFPTKYRVHWSTSNSEFQSEIEAGGRLLWSEYTGFLCNPVWQKEALEFLAWNLADFPWSKLSLRYECSQERARQFTEAFPDDEFMVNWKEYKINKGTTDNLISPQVTLPLDYEGYLTTHLSKSTREKTRRLFRNHIDTAELRITEPTAETIDRDIEALLNLWIEKWAVTKGRKTAETGAANYRTILRTAFSLGILYMPVLWRDDQMIGALGHIVDTQMGNLHFIVAGRDPDPGVPSPGLILHAHSIRWAIEGGYEIYDFCHGNEPYKYSFGAEDKKLNFFSIRRRIDEEDAGFLDPLSTAEALQRTLDFIEAGKTREASAGCRQVLYDCI